MLKTAEKASLTEETAKTDDKSTKVAKPAKSLGQKIKSFFKIAALLLLVVVLISGIVAAGLLGYRIGGEAQSSKTKELESKLGQAENEKSELSTKVDLLNQQLDELGVVTEENQQELETKAAQQKKLQELVNSLPVVAFTPSSSFSSDLKKEIRKKVTSPVSDFYNQEEVKVVAVEVEPATGGIQGFNISVFFAAGGYLGFIHETKAGGGFDYWIPECFESLCKFSDTYKQKHPEVVQRYLSINAD